MPALQCDPAKRRTHRASVLLELREMQKVAYNRVMDDTTEDKDVAQLMRAYVTAEEQRNVLRMRPNPKPIDVTELHRMKAKARERRDAGQIDYRKRRPIQEPAANVTPMPALEPVNADAQSAQRAPALSAQDRTDPGTRQA